MCRMIAAPQGVHGNLVLDAFVRMARGLNTVHEFNPRLGTFAHGDGWGCSFVSEGRLLRYVSLLPCWVDPALDTFRGKMLFALHARRATEGSTGDSRNSHPFSRGVLGQTWHFMHNGTVRDVLSISMKPKGATDSERYFLYLLDSIRATGESVQGVENAVRSMADYTCLNAFLYSRDEMYVVAKSSDPSAYYTLHQAAESHGSVYSSEPLPEISDKWIPLDNVVIKHSASDTQAASLMDRQPANDKEAR